MHTQRPDVGASETVTVRYWAGARAAAGVDGEAVAGEPTVGDLTARLRRGASRPGRRPARLHRARRRPGERSRRRPCQRVPRSRSCPPSPADDGRMPRVDDHRTELSACRPGPPVPPETRRSPRRAPRVGLVATPSCASPCCRRSRRCAGPSPSSPPSSSPPCSCSPSLADPVLLAAGLAWAGVVLAWGWPALHGSSSRFGSSLAIGSPRCSPPRPRPCPVTSRSCASCPSRSSSAWP